MTTTDMNTDELTFALGYSERRAFIRALSRWTSRTVGEYRAAARLPSG